ETKPANPALREGRDLKQRRSGLFWSLPIPMVGVGSTKEALLLPAVRCGALPNPSSDIRIRTPDTKCHIGALRPACRRHEAGSGPPRAKRNLRFTPGTTAQGLNGEGNYRNDRTHPQIPP